VDVELDDDTLGKARHDFLHHVVVAIMFALWLKQEPSVQTKL
jgi:hypothetical protein